MKKSELKNYIKENIISTLSEDTEAEIAKTKELTSAIKDLEVAKKEAGIEEANVGLADLQDIGYDDGEYAFDKHFNKSQLNNRLDTKYYTRGFVQAITDSAESLRLNENATPKGEDFTYDYEDIGQFYLEGFGKDHTLTQDQLGKLGKTITKRFYGGDIKKAYDDVYKTSQNAAAKRLADRGQLQNPRYTDGTSIKEEIPTATMSKINSTVTTIPSAAKQMLDFFNQMAEKESLDFMKNPKFKTAINSLKSLAGDKEETSIKEVENIGLADLEEMGYNAANDFFETNIKSHLNSQIDFQYFQKGLMRGLSDVAGSYGLNENEDAEPTKSDIKKTKGLAKAKEELALLTREMKSLAKKYSKAEGADKEKLVKTLKAKTKLKKELENILDNKKI